MAAPVTIQEIVPLVIVEDIGRAAAYYRDRLGFEMKANWEPEGTLAWCRMERAGAALMLQQACEEDGPREGRGRGVSFYFNCDDADAMYAEITARGLTVGPPQVAFYGMKQVYLRDPDGYEICFQSAVARA